MYNLLIVLALLLTPEEAIRYWANHYNVPVEYAMCVAKKESDMNPYALGDFHMAWGSRHMGFINSDQKRENTPNARRGQALADGKTRRLSKQGWQCT